MRKKHFCKKASVLLAAEMLCSGCSSDAGQETKTEQTEAQTQIQEETGGQ